MRKLDVDALKRACHGQWPHILAALGGLAEAERHFGSTKHTQCPFPERHEQSGGRNKFRLYQGRGSDYTGSAICTCGSWGDGIELLMDLNGWQFPEAVRAINDYLNDPLGLNERSPVAPKPQRSAVVDEAAAEARREQRRRRDELRLARIRKAWGEGVAVTDVSAEPLRRYLATRRIPPKVLEHVDGTEVRFHPALAFHTDEGKRWGTFPALLALLRDAHGKACTLHRTYLSTDGGKAAVPDGETAKKVMAYPSTWRVSGGAIRLSRAGRILGLTEGIETALAVRAATGIPVWATYSADMLKQLDLAQLEGVKLLLIWADKDASRTGQDVALALKARAWKHNIRCQVLLPDMPLSGKSVDWNNVLEREGIAGFPSELEILGGGQ